MFKISEQGDSLEISCTNNRLDISLQSNLQERLEACLKKNPTALVFNMAGIAYIDSSIIGVLIRYNKKINDSGATLTLSDLSNSVRKIFELTKLISFFKVK